MKISVIVPTRERPAQLAGCLQALAGLDFEHDDYEVIVIDDGGTEPLHPWLHLYFDRLHLTVVRQPRTGPGGARNAGARLARGDLLAFTDDDCRPAPDWLRELAAEHGRSPDRLIGGRTVNGLDDNPYATTSQTIIEVAYAHYNRDPDDARFFAANNMAVPAALFRQIGGFDDTFRVASEDRELCDRWLHRGHKMSYAPRAVVCHGHDLNLRRFCRQHFGYGRGARQFHQVRARRGSGSLKSEIRFHGRFLMLLRSPLSRLRPASALVVLTLLGLWQFLNLGGYMFDFARSRLVKKSAAG